MIVVIDANVFNKLYLEEPERREAQGFFEQAVSRNVRLLAPTLFRYEVFEVARRKNTPLVMVNKLIELQQQTLLRLVEPGIEHILKAEEIASCGHSKSGFPSMYDSIYHALAIIEGGSFLTADARHAAKVKKFGALTMLADWRTLFAPC